MGFGLGNPGLRGCIGPLQDHYQDERVPAQN
jgi:hypothetical protein